MTTDKREGGGSNRTKLEAIIAMRLGLEKEWHTCESFMSLSDRIRSKKNFEGAFRKLVEGGCRWDVMLACLVAAETYNLDRVPQPAMPRGGRAVAERDQSGLSVLEQFLRFGDEDTPPVPKPKFVPKPEPPTASERERIRTNLNAVINDLARYDTLLWELAEPSNYWTDALIELPRLLRAVAKLFTEESIGNARTIQSAGQLVPAIYATLVASLPDYPRTPALVLLRSVAAMLNECQKGEPVFSDAQLSEAQCRFKRQYPVIHRHVCAKLRTLHAGPRPEMDNWREAYLRDTD